MSDKVDLRVDYWCDHKAAEYAVMHWHYSRAMPKSKLVKFGVWENGRFIGAVIYGASANNNLGGPFGLNQTEICELVRVALDNHLSSVSKIIAASIHILRKNQNGLRMIVSFADPEHGHNGAIYQAMNWTYAGKTEPADEYWVNGKRWHGRALRNQKPANITTEQFAKLLDPRAQKIKGSSKRRYLFPLDRAMRRQIEPLRRPYPKRETCGQGVNGDTPGDQPGGAGSIPVARSIPKNHEGVDNG